MNSKIRAQILAEMNKNGGDLRAAYDTVLGAGAFETMAGELYDQLRAA